MEQTDGKVGKALPLQVNEIPIWPNTAKQFDADTAGQPVDQIEALAWRAGSELFGFPIPEL